MFAPERHRAIETIVRQKGRLTVSELARQRGASGITIRRDLRAFATGTPPAKTLLEWSESLRGFTKPALVVWANQDAMMPQDHGRRLAALLPDARLIEIEDSGTLIPEDQPAHLAAALRTFLHS